VTLKYVNKNMFSSATGSRRNRSFILHCTWTTILWMSQCRRTEMLIVCRLFKQETNSTAQKPSCEADNCLASREFPTFCGMHRFMTSTQWPDDSTPHTATVLQVRPCLPSGLLPSEAETASTVVALGGLVVSVLAIGPKVRGFKPVKQISLR
jgi:hypothetical protein